MLGETSMTRLSAMSGIARQRLVPFQRSSRPMSSFSAQLCGGTFRSSALPQTLFRSRTWAPIASMGGLTSARFNSTSSAAASAPAVAAGATTTPSSESTSAAATDPLPDIDVTSLPEHIGYLKELGLDYGWGPSSMIQYMIEHLHVWTGLPWWASIVGTAVLVRLAMFKPAMDASHHGTKLANIKEEITPHRNRALAATRAGDVAGSTQARAEIKRIQQKHGISPWKPFLPFLQIPLGFGCYRVVKGMTSLPVPGLAMEQVAWIKDLTIPDPYFLLPIITTLAMHYTLKRGGEAGLNQMKDGAVWKAMLYGLPGISFAFMVFFPSALQLYFVATGALSLAQAYILHSPGFRRFANIALPVQKAPEPEASNKSLRMITDALAAERARMAEMQKTTEIQRTSFIDRAIENIKKSGQGLAKDVSEKVKTASGQSPETNADGTPAGPPRLSKEDHKLAVDYEKRRREEEAWEREQRNHARRQAHLKTMEMQRHQVARFMKKSQDEAGRSKKGRK